MSNTPRNGRIAIVDDKFEQALPIITALSKRRAPFTYYSGRFEELPEEGESSNDVRILFLDINLNPSTSSDLKQVRSTLAGVIGRIISDRNIPYVLIYWSREEDYYRAVLDQIFGDFPKKAPIAKLSLRKLDFFDLDDNPKDESPDMWPEVWQRILGELKSNPVFDLIMCWENLVHKSADETLDALLQVYPVDDQWDNNTQGLFYSLAEAYSGKHIQDYNLTDIIRSSFSTVNMLFHDSVEYDTYKVNPPHLIKEFRKDGVLSNDAARLLNEKLLFSDVDLKPEASGVVSLNIEQFDYNG